MKYIFQITILTAAFTFSMNLHAQNWQVSDSLCRYYLEKQSLDSALFYAEKALEEAKEQQGEKDTIYANMLISVFVANYYLGNYQKAVESMEQEIELRKELHGDKHPYYADALNNLAQTYITTGDYTKAEEVCNEALMIRKEVLGDRHPVYAISLKNMAEIMMGLGDYIRAEELYHKALDIQKETVGEMNNDYAISLCNLALLYVTAGNYHKAEPLYLKALDIEREVVGGKHSDYAQSLHNLASLYFEAGMNDSITENATISYSKAEAMYKEAIAIRKETLGSDHTDYARLVSHLAGLYYISDTADIADEASRSGSIFGVWSFVKNKNPLMRSGLAFAGANRVWNSEFLPEDEDGVLTAQEVTQLDLRKTRLVVMSACETGLGDIKGSEGVYGLHRAFKMAGAGFLIMSLWQVPDAETEEFMTTSYRKLLLQKDVRTAFDETQSEMRKKYDPYYWGAFVLIE